MAATPTVQRPRTAQGKAVCADIDNMVTQLRAQIRREDLNLPSYVPDTTTTAMLIDEMFTIDGPHRDYADHWVRVGGMHCMTPVPSVASSAA